MSERKKLVDTIASQVMIDCKRRCAICVGINQDRESKRGQIAHIDRNRQNNKYANLAFLCIPHHDDYDTVPRQSKSWSPHELRHYKNLVVAEYSSKYPPEDLSTIRHFLQENIQAILIMANCTDVLAVEVDRQVYSAFITLQNKLLITTRSIFSSDLRALMEDWNEATTSILQTISDENYIESGWRRKFDNGTRSQKILVSKKEQLIQLLNDFRLAYLAIDEIVKR